MFGQGLFQVSAVNPVVLIEAKNLGCRNEPLCSAQGDNEKTSVDIHVADAGRLILDSCDYRGSVRPASRRRLRRTDTSGSAPSTTSQKSAEWFLTLR